MRTVLKKKSLVALAMAIFLLCGAMGGSLPRPPGDIEVDLRWKQNRYFILHLPPQYEPGKSLPMVMMLHGGGGNAEGFANSSNMNAVADKYGFIVVYPAGTHGLYRSKFLTWNAGDCCGYAMDKNIDDVGFINAIIGYMAKHYTIDTRRVYAAGFSNGAKMTYKLGCELSQKIAAIGPIGSTITEQCHPARAVPIMYFHGTADKCALYQGGSQCGGCFEDFMKDLGLPAKEKRWPCVGAEDSITRYVQAYQCNPNPVVTFARGDVQCLTYGKCNDGADVTLCTIYNGGHTWPGGGEELPACIDKPQGKLCQRWRSIVGVSNRDIDASESLWRFFSRHSL